MKCVMRLRTPVVLGIVAWQRPLAFVHRRLHLLFVVMVWSTRGQVSNAIQVPYLQGVPLVKIACLIVPVSPVHLQVLRHLRHAEMGILMWVKSVTGLQRRLDVRLVMFVT
jgi:hypothetical protein